VPRPPEPRSSAGYAQARRGARGLHRRDPL